MTEPKTALGVLVAARRLLARRERWIKGSFARTREGYRTSEFSESAVCFCALGAVNRCANLNSKLELDAKRALYPVMSYDISGYNDAPRRTHKQVLAAFDRAIVTLRKAA
jgi:hypothetical protein